MYWECNSLKASETFPRGLSPLVWEKVHSQSIEGLQPRVSGRTTDNALSQITGSDLLEKESVSVTPHHLRNCQWVKKEGDGIGDSMEAAQTTLKLGGAKASSIVRTRRHDQRPSLLNRAYSHASLGWLGLDAGISANRRDSDSQQEVGLSRQLDQTSSQVASTAMTDKQGSVKEGLDRVSERAAKIAKNKKD